MTAQPSRMDHSGRVGGRARLRTAGVFFGSAWVLLLAGCTDVPTGTAINEEPVDEADALGVLASLDCSINVVEESFSCAPSPTASPAEGDLSGLAAAAVIVGNQERYVRLISPTVTTSGGVLSANVEVQNLLLQPLGTLNGADLHQDGVRVFFFTGPTNGVEVANPDGTDTFTSANQPFFQYDQILQRGEVSGQKSWQFTLNDADEFDFQVFVAAEVPEEDNIALSLTEIAGGGDPSGRGHTCGLDEAGNAFCWGHNDFGQLGDNTNQNRDTPTPVFGGLTFSAITVGFNHTCALEDGTGNAFCWGLNGNGRLGDGTDINRPIPTAVAGPLNFTAIAAGRYHTCALEDGTGAAFCWGWNAQGQLGNGGTAESFTPDIVTGGFTFSAITAGHLHTCALEDGTGDGYCWGEGDNGRLGQGPTNANQTSPTAVVGGHTFSAITAGDAHTCALEDGTGAAFCWGWNGEGQLGDDTTGEKFDPTAVDGGLIYTAIAAAGNHTCALDGAVILGRALCWGRNASGEVGDSTFTQRTAPTVVAGGLTFAEIAVGWYHTCGHTADGIGYCWGDRNEGKLGDGIPGQGRRNVPGFVASTR